jgi:hypothetical protein
MQIAQPARAVTTAVKRQWFGVGQALVSWWGVLVWRQCQSLDSSLFARLRSAALWVSAAVVAGSGAG